MPKPDLPAALRDLLRDDIPLDTALKRHFTSAYRQRTNGSWDDLAGFRAHINHLRSITADVEVTTENEMYDGQRYAENHVVRLTKIDGSVVVQEVILIADVAPDGRFARLVEVTNMLEGDEADRGIGSAR